jgi:hypothetical protein
MDAIFLIRNSTLWLVLLFINGFSFAEKVPFANYSKLIITNKTNTSKEFKYKKESNGSGIKILTIKPCTQAVIPLNDINFNKRWNDLENEDEYELGSDLSIWDKETLSSEGYRQLYISYQPQLYELSLTDFDIGAGQMVGTPMQTIRSVIENIVPVEVEFILEPRKTLWYIQAIRPEEKKRIVEGHVVRALTPQSAETILKYKRK